MRRALFVALGGVALVAVTVAVAYGTAGPEPGRVAPNVSLAGRDVGGASSAELRTATRELASRWPATVIRARVGSARLSTTARELGIRVDQARTVAGAQASGRDGSLLRRVTSWALSYLRPRAAEVHLSADDLRLRTALLRKTPQPNRPPKEPDFRLDATGRLTVRAGSAGFGLPPAQVLAAVESKADDGSATSIEIALRRGSVPPRFADREAAELGREARERARPGVAVAAGEVTASIPAKALWPLLGARPGTTQLGLRIDPEKVGPALEKLLPSAGSPAVDAGFTVTPAGVAVTPARAGSACCDTERAAESLLAALRTAPPAPATLPLRSVPPRRTDEDAAKLAIKEPVASFTTPHRCCEPRVQNIHRIADLLRGQVIEPGQTFSINRVVGERTPEKGFVPAPVIENGQEAKDVGGGVSQFATTLFNAAWFAGLGFGEYQSHSLYISRYPYGREATMGFPHPDLQVKNTTPYGVLIWPTYTGTSLTVTLYSSRYFTSVTMSKQTSARQGTCTAVTSERTRVRLTGEVLVDRTNARYRAGPGLNCDGTRAPAPPER